MLSRSMMRKTFGKYLIFHGGCQDDIAQSKIDLESARLLTLQCAHSIDAYGAKAARDQIALIKVAVPNLTIKVIDRAVQVFGGAGGKFFFCRTKIVCRHNFHFLLFACYNET